jgi:hypothetical protein
MITIAITELWSSVVLQETSLCHLVTLLLQMRSLHAHVDVCLLPAGELCSRAEPSLCQARRSLNIGLCPPMYCTQMPGPKALEMDRGETFVHRRHFKTACFKVFSSLVNYRLHVFNPRLLDPLCSDYAVMGDCITCEPASGSAEDGCLGLKWGRAVSEIRILFPFSVVRIN